MGTSKAQERLETIHFCGFTLHGFMNVLGNMKILAIGTEEADTEKASHILGEST